MYSLTEDSTKSNYYSPKDPRIQSYLGIAYPKKLSIRGMMRKEGTKK
jgi:hypothetical protein